MLGAVIGVLVGTPLAAIAGVWVTRQDLRHGRRVHIYLELLLPLIEMLEDHERAADAGALRQMKPAADLARRLVLEARIASRDDMRRAQPIFDLVNQMVGTGPFTIDPVIAARIAQVREPLASDAVRLTYDYLEHLADELGV